MDISNRIVESGTCPVIKLSEPEKDVYSGSGWKIARFVDGTLVDFFDPLDRPYNPDTETMVNEAFNAGRAWMERNKGEHWLVMCSGYELCEPRKLTLSDVESFAQMAHVFWETLSDE
jgi:hypothetical protein